MNRVAGLLLRYMPGADRTARTMEFITGDVEKHAASLGSSAGSARGRASRGRPSKRWAVI
jgi:hypothetical protein